MKREHQCRTTAPIDIKWMISWYDEQLYYSKLSNLDEMHKFLEKTQLRKCDTENCNNHVHIWEIEFITKSFHKENFMPRWLYWCIISDIYGIRIQSYTSSFRKTAEGMLPNIFYEVSIKIWQRCYKQVELQTKIPQT